MPLRQFFAPILWYQSRLFTVVRFAMERNHDAAFDEIHSQWSGDNMDQNSPISIAFGFISLRLYFPATAQP
jgi:hypothetical protein